VSQQAENTDVEPVPRELLLKALGFDLYKTSDAPQIKALIDSLLNEVEPLARSGRVKRFHEEKTRLAIEIIVLNLFVAWWHDRDAPLIHYSRFANFYSLDRLGYDTLIDNVIPYLEQLGYIRDWVDPEEDREKKLQARLIATDKLTQLFGDHELTLQMIRSESWLDFRGKTRRERIKHGKNKGKLKKLPGLRVKLPKDREDLQQQSETHLSNLEKINCMLADASIGLLVSDEERKKYEAGKHEDYDDDDSGVKRRIDFSRKYLRRVFNNVCPPDYEIDMGGRFVGAWWQDSIPSEWRKRIWINDELGIERDFWCMEVSVAYAAKGLDMREFFARDRDDPYVLYEVGESHRKITKQMFIIMLNSNNREEALGAINGYVQDDLNGELPEDFPDIEDVIQSFEQKHSAIESIYGKKKGLKRMFTESRIAERVMLRLAVMNIPVLPVHDSFIVPASAYYVLGDVMRAAFCEVTGQDCEITTEHPERPFSKPKEVPKAEYRTYFRLRDQWNPRSREIWKREEAKRHAEIIEILDRKLDEGNEAFQDGDEETSDRLYDEYTTVYQGLFGDPE